MKTKIYLYIAILISFLFNIVFFFNSRGNNKNISYTNMPNEYLGEQLELSYSHLKLNGFSIEDMEGILWNGNKNRSSKLHSQLKNFSIILYFSELSCFTCIKDQLASLSKIKRIRKKINILLVTTHLRKDVQDELVISKSEFPIFELGENTFTCLDNVNKRFPTATIALFLKDSVIVSSYVSNSETNHFNPQFYESIYRFNTIYPEYQ